MKTLLSLIRNTAKIIKFKIFEKAFFVLVSFILISLDSNAQTLTWSASQTINESIGAVTYIVTLSPSQATTVTVNYTTTNGTAIAPSDYSTTNGTLTFLPGEVTQLVTIPIINDFLSESSEAFLITMSAPVGASINGGNTRNTIITNDDPVLTIIGQGSALEASGFATYTVTLSSLQTYSVSVNYATSNQSALSPSDYTATSGTLIFAPGETSKTFTVPIINDFLSEPSGESFRVTLSGAQNMNASMPMTINTSIADVTITNDDPVLTIVGQGSVLESASFATYTVTLSSAQTYSVSVNYATSNQSAFSPSDYTATSGILNFAPGEISKTFTVAIINDFLNEASGETFRVTLSGAQNVDATMPMTISSAIADVTITNDDPLLNLLGQGSVLESAGFATYTVTLSSAQTYSVSVNYATSNQSASSPSDYTASSGSVMFMPGELSKTFTVPIINDFLSEPSGETFRVIISAAQNIDAAMPMSINNTIVDVSITNDDPILNLLGQGSVLESAGFATYTVTLSTAQTYSVSVNYATSNQGATSPSDYTATSGTLIFEPSETSKTFTVPIINDFLNESSSETFRMTISNAQNANEIMPMTINNSIVDVSILNDDPILNLVGQGSVLESAGFATYTVTLSSAQTYSVSVNYATSNQGAVSPSDYTATSGTLIFEPSETSKIFTVPIINDFLNESSAESYRITISGAQNVNTSTPMSINNTIADVSILNDDPILSMLGQGSVIEAAGFATYTVTLSSAQTYSVSVNYTTSNQSAISPNDYTATSGALLFEPSETSKIITVPIINDFISEPSFESFRMTISNPQNINASMPMSINSAIADITITNDDPTLSILTPSSVLENAGVQIFTVTMSAAQAYAVAVDYDMNSTTAILGDDYTFSTCAQTLVFAPGETSKIFSISIVDDGISEPTQTYNAIISNARNLNANMPMSILNSTVGATIIDNDNAGCGSNVLSKPVISGTTLYCPNTNLNLSIAAVPSAIGYVWSGPNSFTATGTSISINNVTAVQSGVYTVRAYRAGGTVCDTSVGANVNVSIVPCASTVSVKLYIEGYYIDSGRMTTALLNHGLLASTTISDSIDIELHNSTAPYDSVTSIRTALFTNGTAIATYNAIQGNYYLVIKHHSSIQTWSSTPVTISASPITYDFTNAASKAFGNNMKEVEPGIWALFGGEIIQDENIDLLDSPNMEDRINAFDTCFLTTDLNGDGNTDLLDATILEENINNFIFAAKP
ncbi:MAG TPA: Calx-beta domain-containing protein [Chitinophagaceae bacterium]|nr:Calx-beta domain-containing protein [Chitinophagaceae bacterium]